MRNPRNNNHHMQQLMTRTYDIKPSRKPFLGKLDRVGRSAKSVAAQRHQHPFQPHALGLECPAVARDAVDDGDDGGEGEAAEGGGAERTHEGGVEFGLEREDGAGKGEGGLLRFVSGGIG